MKPRKAAVISIVDCHSGTGHFMIKTARSPDSKEEAANA
jgi:hypothetical protein